MSKYTSEDIIYLAGVPEDFKDKYVKMINELIESKLKEQRDICANEIEDEKETGLGEVIKAIKELIRNAPSPKI